MVEICYLGEGGKNAGILVIGRGISPQSRLQPINAVIENFVIRAGGQRKVRFEILEEELALLEYQFEFARIQHFTEWPPKDTKQYSPIETLGGRVPVNIEAAGLRGVRAVLGHIQPPRLLHAGR